MKKHLIVISMGLLLLVPGCSENEPEESCEGYPDQASSTYLLPWEPGVSYEVYTGNCTSGNPTHSGTRRYAYDFRMPVGTVILASRSGRVAFVEESHSDDDHTFGNENIVTIDREDGTFDLYIHFMQNGVDVAVNDFVEAGDTLGRLGTSGSIGPDLIPHLHFESVTSFNPIVSTPVTFSNTRPHPNGLVVGETYVAE